MPDETPAFENVASSGNKDDRSKLVDFVANGTGLLNDNAACLVSPGTYYLTRNQEEKERPCSIEVLISSGRPKQHARP
jgi:hypothetical protein